MPTASNNDLASLVDRCDAILAAVDARGGDLTAAEATELANLQDQFDRERARDLIADYRAGQPQNVRRRTDPDPIEGSDGSTSFNGRPFVASSGRWGTRPRNHTGP